MLFSVSQVTCESPCRNQLSLSLFDSRRFISRYPERYRLSKNSYEESPKADAKVQSILIFQRQILYYLLTIKQSLIHRERLLYL